MNLFEQQTQTISNIFSEVYIKYLATLIGLMFFMGFTGRLLACTMFYLTYKYSSMYENRQYKTLWNLLKDLNKGLNKIGTSLFFIVLVNALLFSVGAVAIIQTMVYDEKATLLTLMGAYIVMKFAAFLIVKVFRYVFVHTITGLKL